MSFRVALQKKEALSLLLLFVAVSLCSFSVFAQQSHAQQPHNPFIHDNSIYVSKQGVYKFNLETLTLQWQALTNIHTFEPVVLNDLLYIGSSQGLYALDIETGGVVWRFGADQTIFSPAAVDKHLYAGSQHGVLYDISPLDGGTNWQRNVDGWVYSPALVENQNEFHLWTGGQAHEAIALAASTSEIIHRVPLAQEVVFSPVAIGSDAVGFNLFNGSTVIIDADQGDITSVIAGATQAKTMRAEKGLIYRSSRDGTLTIYDNRLKEIKWRQKIFKTDLTQHAGFADALLLSDQDQWLVLFDIQRQKVIWRHKMTGNWFAPIQLSHNEIMVFFHVGVNFDSIKAVIVNTNNQQAG